MAGRKKKGIVEKVADAVDHIIHPEKEVASQEDAEKMIESGEAEIPAEAIVESPVRQNQMQSDLAKHPKFAKFKSQGENQP